LPALFVEFDPPEPCPHSLKGDSADLVYFLSLAFSARYGSTHELTQAALLLRGEFKIDLRPLLTFADRHIEEPADAEAKYSLEPALAPVVARLEEPAE
jgi:hypothetical protein